MTKATPAGRTLTDPPAVPGGNPEHRESGQYLGQAACSNKKAPSARAPRGFFFAEIPLSQRSRLLITAALVLAVGVVAGVSIYLAAEDEPESTSYVIVGDAAYPVDPTRSKTYVRQLERFGGKAAVLFDEFNRWFASLWQGKALGITVAWISIFVALVLFALARRLPCDHPRSRERP